MVVGVYINIIIVFYIFVDDWILDLGDVWESVCVCING